MNLDGVLDDWDEGFLGAALNFMEEYEASRNPTQNANPNPPLPPPIPGPAVGDIAGGFSGDGISTSLNYSPPRELSQRVSEKIESSIVSYGSSQAFRAPRIPKNGGYKRERESERLKNELERLTKELFIKERECKELQKDREKKDEQLKDALLHIENKDAEIRRLKRTNLTYSPQVEVQADGKSAICELKDQIMANNGLIGCSALAIQENCFPKNSGQSKRTRTKGVQTDIIEDGSSTDANMVHALSSKLHALWGFPGKNMLGRNLISELFVTCSEEFCLLFKCINCPSKTNLESFMNRSISDTTVHEGMQPLQLVDDAKVSRLYEILMKVRRDVAPLQTLIEGLFDLCIHENVIVAHKALRVLHALLQHLSYSTRLNRRNNVLVDQSQSPERRIIGLHNQDKSETSNMKFSYLENEDRNSRASMDISFEMLILIFEKMQQIALSKREEYIQVEALSVMNLTLMASNPSERERFGLVQLLEALPKLLQKEIGLCVRKQAVRLLFLLLNCPKVLSVFCDETDHAKTADCLIATPTLREGINRILEGLAECLACAGVNTEVCIYRMNFYEGYMVHVSLYVHACPKVLSVFCDETDHAKTADCLIATPTLREGINRILEGLAECLACAGVNTEELKLQRDVIVVLAFIASSGSSGFDVLLYSATPQRLNFLELIIRILAFGMDTEEAKSQTFCKERFSVFRESLILLNRLSSNPSYSNATLEVLTRKATATLTINVSNRMSRKSQSHWKRHATNKMQLEEELVDLARMFKARVFTFLGQNQ
ncbi:uncharacterized protein LOC109825393 [Asparagus officinalis]|uniref:uncharacterized protein LOC109825393 n=1 Tax=Asparagus officinalis TaxID=4686 RepID=UPI00098E83FA|nr:uncharacterized protein LOC109825393 [Asparagus officinalis]